MDVKSGDVVYFSQPLTATVMYILSVYCVVLCGIVCEGGELPHCVVLISSWADACVLYSSADTWTEETREQPPPSVLLTFNPDMCNTHIHMWEKLKENAKSGVLVRRWTNISHQNISNGRWQRFYTSVELYWRDEHHFSKSFDDGGREHYLTCLSKKISSHICSTELIASDCEDIAYDIHDLCDV